MAAQAQPNDTQKQRAKKLTRQMDKTLNLRSVQKKEIMKINFSYIQRQDALQGKQDDESRKELLQLIAERNYVLKNVLTPSQYVIFMECHYGI
jgi:hypothetical protein